MRKYNFIDLFSGCGGLSEGFLKSDKYKPLAHVEWDHRISAILKKNLIERWNFKPNHVNSSVITFDIQKSEELLFGNWSKESCSQFAIHNNNKIIN